MSWWYERSIHFVMHPPSYIFILYTRIKFLMKPIYVCGSRRTFPMHLYLLHYFINAVSSYLTIMTLRCYMFGDCLFQLGRQQRLGYELIKFVNGDGAAFVFRGRGIHRGYMLLYDCSSLGSNSSARIGPICSDTLYESIP